MHNFFGAYITICLYLPPPYVVFCHNFWERSLKIYQTEKSNGTPPHLKNSNIGQHRKYRIWPNSKPPQNKTKATV